MMNFSINISTFETFDSVPVNITLNRWIRSTMNKKCSFAKQVHQYRQTGKVELKKSLPLATVGAVCEGGRKRSDVETRTGWIALDVDAKDNPHLNDAGAIRNAIANIVYVAFAGLSVSGKGVWALVKVENPQQQDKHFEQLQIDFKSRGIILDSSKGKNPNDARFYSFDQDAYIADDFKIYDRLPKQNVVEKIPRSSKKRHLSKFTNNGTDTLAKVERLISKINTDITAGYDNWLKLGFAIEDEFGESGRDYFHAISSYHSNYNRRECDRQYTHCLNHRGSGIGIGTLFHVCRQHGITLNKKYRGSQGKYEAQKPANPENNVKSTIDAPYGMNPYTGEVFDERGYPADWDDIQLDPKKELMNRDDTFASLVNIFDAEPITNIQLT